MGRKQKNEYDILRQIAKKNYEIEILEIKYNERLGKQKTIELLDGYKKIGFNLD